MLDQIIDMFTRRDPRRDAALALTRIMNQYDMVRLSYEDGICEDRRAREERNVAMGVWLFPCSEQEKGTTLDFTAGVPAITHDLRAEGFGIMTPLTLEATHFVVAAPEDNGRWRFFRCQVRHNTRKPGGWHHLGLQTERTIDFDGDKRIAFRAHVETVESVSKTVKAEDTAAV